MKSIHVVIFALLWSLWLLAAAEFVPGWSGQAMRGRCSFPAVGLKSRHGGIQCWFRLDSSPVEMRDSFLLGIGTNREGWFHIRFNAGKLIVLSKSVQGTIQATADVGELESGRWYNLAVTWGQLHSRGKLMLYLDGLLKAQEQGALPDTFSPGNLGLGYNTAHYASPDFPGVIDEFAFYEYPLPEHEIRARMQSGFVLQQNLVSVPGCLIYAAFDGHASSRQGAPLPPEKLTSYLVQQQQKQKILRYGDELDFQYSFDVPMPEQKTPGILNDGNDQNSVNWHNRKVAVICEFDRTCEVSSMEIIVKKHTKWYILKELHISLDDGSGSFAPPVIVKTYGVLPKSGVPLIDESCRSYCYQPVIQGYASRIKISFVGDAAISVSEIRIRGRTAQPPPDDRMYFWGNTD